MNDALTIATSNASHFSVAELKRYSRQIYLPEIAHDGQLAIKQTHACIIGLGGLGSPASLYLAAAGIGKLTLIDFDTVELSNLQRQIIHSSADIGKNKALSAAETLTQLNPHVELHCITDKLNEHQLRRQLKDCQICLDCSDNFSTRYVINRLCKQLQIPLISAAVIGFSGQLIGLDFRHRGPCYECLYPNRQESGENCQSMGVLSAAAGVLGSMQATEALKVITQLPQEPVPQERKLLLIDTLSWQQRSVKFAIDPYCPNCC